MRKKSYLTVTDQFCGAGGSSEGVVQLSKRKKLKSGIEVRMALNHWKLAIETHNTNHPNTDHDCTDISACDPRRYPTTDILITSPECTNHSLAKGRKKKPDLFTLPDEAEERSRATMWDVPRFAEHHRYNLIITENVVDARSWELFDPWLMAMHTLGYKHHCVYLNSMHTHPTPQSRDRMYVVFWKKGNKAPDLTVRPKGWCHHCSKETETYQAWKRADRQWGKYKQQYLFRCPTCNNVVDPYYYAAFNAIDWTLPGQRIGDREKPLSTNTLKRIQYGIDKYWNHPSIITGRYSSPGATCKSVQEPLKTQTTLNGLALLSPLFMNAEHDSTETKKVRNALQDPAFTQTTRAINSIVMPFLIKNYGGNFNAKNAPVDLREVLGTLTTSDHHGLLSPFTIQYNGKSKTTPIVDALNTLVTNDRYGLISTEAFNSFMTWYYNGSDVASHIIEAARTFSTKDRAGLVLMGKKPKIEDCYYRMLVPQEVKVGMAFRPDYIVKGNGREQVKQCGNAVTPPAMEMLMDRVTDTLL